MRDSADLEGDQPLASDDALRDLAGAAGVSTHWIDARGEHRQVSVESLRSILAAMDMVCATAGDIAESRARLRDEEVSAFPPPLITADLNRPVPLPFKVADGVRALLEFEEGGAVDLPIDRDESGRPTLRPIGRIGYHRLFIGDRVTTLAVAPPRCWTVEDIAPGHRLWGLTAQVHGLRRAGDGGIGDFGAVAQLARAAARHRADALSLSPTHALFAADDNHFTPYSPSSRLFHNILLADPQATFSRERVENARTQGENPLMLARLEAADLIDWPAASRARKGMLRALFNSFRERELAAPANMLAGEFNRFRATGGEALERHAIFETLHVKQFQRDFTKWSWRDWPAELRDCDSPIVRGFAASNANEVTFHVFCQWLAERSLRAAQGAALSAGMRIGLISDLAIGMNNGGSQAWSAPNDLLLGLSVGAPPDPLAPRGQNWGLTTFAPRALARNGFSAFIATLRAALRNAGGARIDHVMGIARLWLTPDGMDASEGAYLAYPTTDLLRLIALESYRHRAVIIGEDLGTVPDGLRERLTAAGLYGMRVMQFERHHDGFNPPDWYPSGAVAMTSTHDTATTAGYWTGHDLAIRADADQLPPWQTLDNARDERAGARHALWNAFKSAGVATREHEPSPHDPGPAVDAAVAFLARTPASLALLPLEDALGVVEQPNLPGTTTEHPNWRRRYQGLADGCLDNAGAAARLRPLAERG